MFWLSTCKVLSFSVHILKVFIGTFVDMNVDAIGVNCQAITTLQMLRKARKTSKEVLFFEKT